MKIVSRNQVQELLEQGAQLVEVLEEGQYREAHLPGAIHVPAWDLTRDQAQRLTRDRPVVLYCFDGL